MFSPGQKVLSASALNRLAEKARGGFPGIPGAGHGNASFQTPQGTIILPETPRMRFAVVTGRSTFAASGNGNPRNCIGNAYDWIPLKPYQCGTFVYDDNTDNSGNDNYQTAFEANGDDSVTEGTIVLLWEGYLSDTNDREWIFWNGGGAASARVIRVLGLVGDAVHSGCFSGADAAFCPVRSAFAVTQQFNRACNKWEDAQCVVLADIKGRNLVIGQRYIGHRLSTVPDDLQAAILPYDSPCTAADFPAGTSLYFTDLCNNVCTVYIENEVGQLCSGSGQSGTSISVLTDDPNLIVYQAVITTWNSEQCAWEVVDSDIYAAEMHGCELDIGIHYEAHYDTMVPVFDSGTGAESCKALYLVDHVDKAPRGVADVRLGANGNLDIYVWQAVGRCGAAEAILSHSITSCCQSGSGGGSGGSGGPCCGGRAMGPMYCTLTGYGTHAMTFIDPWWYTSFNLTCGKTLYLRWGQCSAEYSCDDANYVPLSHIAGETDDCGPPFVSAEYTGAVMENPNAGCVSDPVCGIISGIFFSE